MKTKEEITEGKKLIAEFDGGRFYKSTSGVLVGRQVCLVRGKERLIHTLRYDSSWDWLMPVVEEIHILGYSVSITRWKTEIFSNEFPDEEHFACVDKSEKEQMIILCFSTVVDFFEFYKKKRDRILNRLLNER